MNNCTSGFAILTPFFHPLDVNQLVRGPQLKSFWFFFGGIIIFGFYITNLFVGVMFESFLGFKNMDSRGVLISQAERRWRDYEKRLGQVCRADCFGRAKTSSVPCTCLECVFPPRCSSPVEAIITTRLCEISTHEIAEYLHFPKHLGLFRTRLVP